VNAGPDQTVKLTATVTLTGTVSDDGIPNPPGAPRVHWQLQSGPGKVIFTDPQSLMTTVHFTATGLYILQLVADDGAQEATDTVTITVVDPNTSFVVLGQSRTAEVGKSLELSATIDGPWATLPTGTLTYQWSQLGGPATVTFATPTQATTTATFTAPGDYLLQLAITNGSEVISGTVTVTVNAINQRPRVNAGVDQNLARPGTLELSAIITDDSLPGPTHKLTVQWTQMSGPAAVTFTNSSSLTTTVTFTTAGAYLLKVTADDSELIGEDTITILVGSEGAYKLFMPIMPR
jgi:hypothetical protein